MPVILRIALRNLKQHMSKTLIIGTIIALGVIVLIVGNSFMDTAGAGIRKAFLDNFTGDVMISGKSKGKISLFGVQSPGHIIETPTIPDYEKVRNYIDSRKEVDISTPQISGVASIRANGQPDKDKRAFSFLVGIEPETYRQIFTTATLKEGEYLKSGQPGILVSEDNMNTIRDRLGVDIKVGDSIKLTSFLSNRGPKIKEVPIVGVFNLEQFSDGMEMISYIDVQTLRALKGMTVGSLSEVDLEEFDTALLDMSFDSDSSFDSLNDSFSGISSLDTEIPMDIDQLFTDDTLFTEYSEEDALIEEDVFSLLETSEEEREAIEQAKELDTGAWEFLLLKMNNPRRANSFIKDINKWFKEQGLEVQAGNWKKAAGPFAISADVVRIIFNIVVLLVVIVAIFIVINTLVISVIERTGEIGTMRALGGQKNFVRKLFNMEIIIIVCVFGILGIAAALLILWNIALVKIPATNSLLEVLFAGPFLVPVISIWNILLTFGILFVVGLLANLYPLHIALKVQPIEAMREN